MKPRILARGTAAFALFLLCVESNLRAQAVAQPPAKPAATAPSDDLIELSPFEVKDTNENPWNASSTLLGNRTNQELVKVPVTVDVLTADFMHDIGLFNMDDAGAFISGV